MSPIVSERVVAYLNDWEQRTEKILSNISDEQLDLSTALFLIDSLIEPSELKQWAQKVLEKDRQYIRKLR